MLISSFLQYDNTDPQNLGLSAYNILIENSLRNPILDSTCIWLYITMST